MALKDRLVFQAYDSTDVDTAITDSETMLTARIGSTITEGGDYDEVIVSIALKILEYAQKVANGQINEASTISSLFLPEQAENDLQLADETMLILSTNDYTDDDGW